MTALFIHASSRAQGSGCALGTGFTWKTAARLSGRRISYKVLSTALLGACLLAAFPARAQESEGLIRDAEIERDIRVFVTPVFRAAGLDAQFVQIYLVNNQQINAFVAGGQRVFINTGLLMRSQTANQIVGVVAHETGHIAGGHLVRSQEALENATVQSIVGVILGTAAAVVDRNGSVAAAGAMAGQSMGIRSLFAYSIGQEERADQAAVTFLDRTRQSARGLLQFFEILQKEEFLPASDQDPYLRTHPLTEDRISFVREHVEHSPYSDAPDPASYPIMHDRILAKLRGFLLSPGKVVELYPETDKSVAARYARAAAYHRIPMHDRAMAEIDSLLREQPNDPYFNELRGQILFEDGMIPACLPSYRRAVQLAPDEPLLKVELAAAELEDEQHPALAREALGLLQEAIRLDDSNTDAWHDLAIAWGRVGNLGQTALALAEEAILAGDLNAARAQATRATQLLPAGSPGWIRADDIRREAKYEKDDDD